MQIEQIDIANFKSIKKMTIKPSKVNFLVGPNGYGKTSVLQAIRYALTGAYPADPIAAGSEKATVRLRIPDIGLLTRNYMVGKNEVRLNGKVTTQKSVIELFAERYGIPMKTSDVLTSSDIGQMSSGDLSSYLLGENMIPISIDVESLLSLCEISDEAKTDLCQEMAQMGLGAIKLKDIDRVWNNYKARRRILKQQTKEAEVRSKFEGPVPARTVEEIDQELMTASQRQGSLLAAQQSYSRIMETRRKGIADIEAGEKQIYSPVEKPDPKEKSRLLDAQAKNGKHLEEIAGVIAMIIDTGKRLKKILKNLENSACPISEKLTCTTDKTPIRSELTQTFENEREQYQKQLHIQEQLTKEKDDLQKALDSYTEQERCFQRQQLIRERIEAIHRNLPADPGKPNLDELESIKQDVGRLNQEKATALRYQEALKYAQSLEDQQKALRVCEEIVEQLDPKNGIRRMILEHSIQPLEQFFNQRLQQMLPEYTARLECDNGFTIKLQHQDGSVIDAFDSASQGELCQIWFALLDLINSLSPYRVLLFDKTDSMDADALVNLIRMLQKEEIQNEYDHIFVAMIDYAEVSSILDKLDGSCSVIRMRPDCLAATAA